jgi:hypothetical protein
MPHRRTKTSPSYRPVGRRCCRWAVGVPRVSAGPQALVTPTTPTTPFGDIAMVYESAPHTAEKEAAVINPAKRGVLSVVGVASIDAVATFCRTPLPAKWFRCPAWGYWRWVYLQSPRLFGIKP